MRGYVICATPRSGSNYLCSLLASTGVLGRPLEWFNPDVVRRTGFSDWDAGPEVAVQRILHHAATPNGVYALKVFPGQFDQLGADWVGQLPQLRFAHLTRHDVLGQAISYARAAQTEAWTSAERALREPIYDAVAIAARLGEVTAGDARWRAWFARNNIAPLRLTYEDVCARPADAVSRIAERLRIAVTGWSPRPVDVAIQRDADSERWRERFLATQGDLTRL